MMVLKANQEQFNELNGYTKNQSVLIFMRDKNSNFIVGEQVLNDINFREIKDKLLQLQVIDYSPITENDMP